MQGRFISPQLSASDEEEPPADLTCPFPSLDTSLIAYLEGRDLPDLPPLNTDGPVQSSPVVGTKGEKQAIRRKKATKKQKNTIARQQEAAKDSAARQLKDDAEDVLQALNQKGLRFGQLRL